MSGPMEFTRVAWRKSSRSSASGDDCVEVAAIAPVVAVRDSKDPDGPKLILDGAAWRTLNHRIKTGDHGPA